MDVKIIFFWVVVDRCPTSRSKEGQTRGRAGFEMKDGDGRLGREFQFSPSVASVQDQLYNYLWCMRHFQNIDGGFETVNLAGPQ